MLRVKYSHQRASEMYRQGQQLTDVARMLVEEGATEAEAPALARQYYRSFLLYHLDEQRRLHKSADMQKLIGAVLLVGSAAFYVLLYLASDGKISVIFYGVLLVGLICLIRAFSAQKQAQTNLDRLTEKLRQSEQAEAVAAS